MFRSFEYLSNFSLVSFYLSLQSYGGAMQVLSNAAVTFIGTANVMKLNTAPSGKSIYSASNNLKFTVVEKLQ